MVPPKKAKKKRKKNVPGESVLASRVVASIEAKTKSKQKRRKNEGGEEWNGGGSNKGEGGKKETSPTVMVDYYNQFSHIFISVHHGRSRASKKIIILSLTHSLSLSFPSLPPFSLCFIVLSFFFFPFLRAGIIQRVVEEPSEPMTNPNVKPSSISPNTSTNLFASNSWVVDK